jgi:uncharacterized membrane protein (UPF0127 family)
LLGFMSYNLLADFMRPGHLTGLLLLVSESRVVVFTIVRRRARLIDRSLDGAFVTVVSVAGPPLLRATDAAGLLPDVVTALMATVGLGWVIAAKFTLGRSFGIVPANRGVVVGGPYIFVRHPIYTGYLITHLIPDRAPHTMECDDRHHGRLGARGAGLIEERVLRSDVDYQSLPPRWMAPRAGSVLMLAVALMNGRTGIPVADAVEVAATRALAAAAARTRPSEPSAALILAPCLAVHTAFMRFAIDVVFVDRDGRALKIVSDLAPWRMAWSLSAHAVVELAAGRLRSCEVVVGDRLYLPQPASSESASSGGFAESMRIAAARRPDCRHDAVPAYLSRATVAPGARPDRPRIRPPADAGRGPPVRCRAAPRVPVRTTRISAKPAAAAASTYSATTEGMSRGAKG